MYTNAESLFKKLDELKLKINMFEPSIIAITECKGKNLNNLITLPEYQLENYTFVHCNLDKGIGLGVMIYIHNSITYNGVQFNSSFEEYVFIEVKLKDQVCLVGVIYRTNSMNNTEDLCNLFYEINMKKYNEIIIMGDFNYKNINWTSWMSSGSKENTFLNCLRDCYFEQHTQEETRCRGRDTPSLLDLIITSYDSSMSNFIYDAPLGKSDHCVLIFTYSCNLQKDSFTKKRYCYSKADFSLINKELQKINWHEELNKNQLTINEQWLFLKDTLINVENKLVPTRNIVRGLNQYAVPYGEVARRKLKEKRTLWNQYRRSITDRETKFKNYKRKRNQITKMTKKIRKNYEADIALNIKKSPKTAWRYINSKKKMHLPIDELIYEENGVSKLANSDKEKAQVLSNYFSTIFSKRNENDIPTLENRPILTTMDDLKITEEVVYSQLKSLKVDKSPGPDKLHPLFLKMTRDQITKPLQIIFANSLKEQQVPSEWKIAAVSAIYKKGNKKSSSNYRPISLTSIVCKILERIIKSHIMEHMLDNNLFSNRQFGFINGRSTTLQLLNIIEDWTTQINMNTAIDCVYFDYMKAFDSICHRRLSEKLKAYGIQTNLLEWIKDYLSDRKQYVCVNDHKSDMIDVLSGVPQGSVLGPLLFVIFMNDLPDVVQHSTIMMYADDTKLYRKVTTLQDTQLLQVDINNLTKWSMKWNLRFNPLKCKFLNINPRRIQIDEHNYLINDDMINHVTTEKDIGVHFDEDLSFESHISGKINTAYRMSYVIRRSYKYLTPETFVMLFKALVRTHLDYAVPIWSPWKISQIENIERVQRKATKQLPKFHDMTYTERLKRLQLPTLSYRRIRADMIEAFKILRNVYDQDVVPLLKTTASIHTRVIRGNTLKLYKQSLNRNINIRNNAFPLRIINTWNSLPDQVIMSENLNKFKSNLDKHWSDQDVVYNYRAPLKL